MSKSKKTTTKYGLKITKPFSKAMYDHNDQCAQEMKKNILTVWTNELLKMKEYCDVNAMTEDWDAYDIKSIAPKLLDIQKGVQAIGYGSGYSLDMVDKEFRNELETMANWQLHENYSYLCFEGLVERTTLMMVGFDWEKCDYSKTDNIWKIKEIAQGRLRWSSCSDEDGNHWKEPYIKCDSEGHGNTFVRRLFAEGIEAVVDLYEDEDGDDDYGRTIIRKIWSVRIKNIKK
tara:strand:+ start:31 stop:723 length:693 start_codon:yes stop_codon:yes gene_type:complete